MADDVAPPSAALVSAAFNVISAHLAEISTLFGPGTKLTLLVRQPSHPDGTRDMVVTDDTIENVITALRIAQCRAVHG